MSSPIISVEENRVTVTANDTEANIRAAAGFAEAPEAEKPAPDAKEAPEPEKASADDAERNPDGTFKAKTPAEKADETTKPTEHVGDPRKSHQAKINAAIAKQREAERRAEALEAEIQALRRPAQAPAPQAAPSQAQTPYLQLVQRYQSLPDAPKLDDFAGLDDPYLGYQTALAAFIADQRMVEREQRESVTRAERERESRQRASIEVGEQTYPGFIEQLRAHPITYSDAAKQVFQEEALQDPQFSAELMHYLLTHLDDAARLAATQTPIAAARELGRISERLSSASSGPETVVTQTNAKPLIKPVRPSVMAPESSPPDDLPFGPRYIAAMNERDRKAREAKRA